MIYRFDSETLQYIKVKWPRWLLISSVVMVTLSLVTTFSISLNEKIIEQKIIVIVNKQNKFDGVKLTDKIKSMNFQFPEIIYAQALLETDSFRSNIFKENNNLFGMKRATIRVNVASGVQYDHAVYSNWMDSLFDYALYYATYLSQIKTEDDYFSYLSQFYAEDKRYVDKLKLIIKRYDLKKKFN